MGDLAVLSLIPISVSKYENKNQTGNKTKQNKQKTVQQHKKGILDKLRHSKAIFTHHTQNQKDSRASTMPQTTSTVPSILPIALQLSGLQAEKDNTSFRSLFANDSYIYFAIIHKSGNIAVWEPCGLSGPPWMCSLWPLSPN